MADIVTMDKIIKLMEYLGVEDYIIPHYNLPLPQEADGENYRPEKIFRLFKDGTMLYKGCGFSGTKRDIIVRGIKPSERFLTRAYVEMVRQVKKKVEERTQRGGIPNLEHLILKFNGIDFINGNNAIT